MKTTRRYSIGAAIADCYVVGIVLGAPLALLVAVTRRPLPLWALFLQIAFNLTLVLVYHSAIAHRVPFRSLGEVIMGRAIADGRKQWTNPYGVNRTVLFVVLFLALVLAGNSWDSLADESFYTSLTMPVVAGRITVLGCLLVGLMLVGRARAAGGYLVAGYFALGAIGNLFGTPPPGAPLNVSLGLVLLELLAALAAAVVCTWYCRAAGRRSRLAGDQRVQ